MKYIKNFEESNGYYKKSDESTFKSKIQDSKLVPFDPNDFQVIKNKFNKLPGGYSIDISRRADFKNDTIATKYGGVMFSKGPLDKRDGIIYVQSFKSEDEYFYTKIKYKNIRTYYTCDQLYGLVELMKNIDELV